MSLKILIVFLLDNEFSFYNTENKEYTSKLNKVIKGINLLKYSGLGNKTNPPIKSNKLHKEQKRRLRTTTYGKWYMPITSYKNSVYNSIFD